jgi:hypothetical protein
MSELSLTFTTSTTKRLAGRGIRTFCSCVEIVTVAMITLGENKSGLIVPQIFLG